jgi:hypothetical protein
MIPLANSLRRLQHALCQGRPAQYFRSPPDQSARKTIANLRPMPRSLCRRLKEQDAPSRDDTASPMPWRFWRRAEGVRGFRGKQEGSGACPG